MVRFLPRWVPSSSRETFFELALPPLAQSPRRCDGLLRQFGAPRAAAMRMLTFVFVGVTFVPNGVMQELR
jgi:hypothetical protein